MLKRLSGHRIIVTKKIDENTDKNATVILEHGILFNAPIFGHF